MAPIPQPTALTSDRNQAFLEQLAIGHGPIRLLGQFFLRAVSELNRLGFEIIHISAEDLLAANLANADNWLPLVQIFDPRWSDVGDANQLAIAVRKDGRIVGAHAVRFFDWTNTNFHDEIASYRLLYRDPQPKCSRARP